MGSHPEELAATLRELGCLDPVELGLDAVLERIVQAAAIGCGSTGAAERAVELVEDALGRVDPADEPVRAAMLLAGLGDYSRIAGDEAGALAAFQRAERLLDGTPPSAERAACSPPTPTRSF